MSGYRVYFFANENNESIGIYILEGKANQMVSGYQKLGYIF